MGPMMWLPGENFTMLEWFSSICSVDAGSEVQRLLVAESRDTNMVSDPDLPYAPLTNYKIC